MENKDDVKEIDIKNRTCHYFNDIMRLKDIVFINIFWTKSHIKITKIF